MDSRGQNTQPPQHTYCANDTMGFYEQCEMVTTRVSQQIIIYHAWCWRG